MPVVPLTSNTPVCVTLPLPLLADKLPPTVVVPTFNGPLEVTVKLPEVVSVPKVNGPASVIDTLLPVIFTAPPKVLPVLGNVTFPVPAATPVVPVTFSAPVCVTSPLPLLADKLPPTVVVPTFNGPLEVTVRLPEVVSVPKVSGPASVSDTLLPLVLTGPPKTFPALVKVISAGEPPLVALSVEVPPMFTDVPVACVIVPPPVVSVSVPVVVSPPKVVPPFGLFNVTLLPAIFTNDRLPVVCVTLTLPPMSRVPPVCAKELVEVKLPVPPTLPPLWL